MIKKIFITLPVLLLILLAASSVFSYAAEKTDEEFELLRGLDILSGEYGDYSRKNSVSQMEFLKALTGFVTDDKIEDGDIYEYAKRWSLISQADTEELNSAISYERALSLTLNLLGYADWVEANGQDIRAVLSQAQLAKLTKGLELKVGDRLNGEAMITLLSNAMEAKVMNVIIYKDDVDFKKGSDTPLEAYRGIAKYKGTVTHTSDTSLYGENGIGEGRIGIDGVFYDIGYKYGEEILGQTVDAYIKDDAVLYAAPRYGDTEKIEIEADDILKFADDFSEAEYYEGDKTKTIKFNPALVVIYNGKNYADYRKADLMPETGKIVCVDCDSDKRFDIVFVYSYDTVVVKNVSQSYKTISNLYSVPADINILDLNDTSIDLRIYSEGKEAAFSSILANNILSVAQSKGNDKIVTIYISKETVSGEFSAINDSENTVVINESEYKISDVYYDAVAAGDPIDKISVGNVYTCYLDAFGNIAFVKRDAGNGYEYAFLLKQEWIKKENSAVVRLLNSDGDWEYVYYAEKVKLNEQNRQDALTVFNSLGKDAIEPQLIMIKRDAEGKIKAVRTATVSDTYDPNGFTLAQATEFEKYYWSQDSSFNCRHYVKYDAKVFIKPSSAADVYNKDMYAVVPAGYFKGERRYKYLAYNVDEFGFPDAFVVSANTPGTETTIYVNKIKTMLNSDGQVVRAVVGNLEGLTDMTVQISSDFTDEISAGDIIEVKLKDAVIVGWNNDAETNSSLTTIDASTGIGWARQYHLADATSPARPKDAPADNYNIHSNYRFFRGDIKDLNVERRMLLLDCGESGMIPVYIRDGANINIYNSNTEKYELRTISDIPPKGYAIVRMNGNNVVSVGIYE